MLNCDSRVDGPETTDQLPIPDAGGLAARVVVGVVIHNAAWSGPAFEVVAGAFTVIETVSVEAVQGGFEIVHWRM